MKKKNSVLVVDDSDINIMALSHILNSDYDVYVSTDGQDGIETAIKLLPDIILLDVVMPDMDGYEVISVLKNCEKTKDIPVLFVTGLNDVGNEEKGLKLGAVDYITKPFSTEVVKHRVQNQVEIINLKRELEASLENAKAASRAKSEFLANMSHEIRTPMNAIIGVTELMMLNDRLPEDIGEGLDKVFASSNLLLGIINDILDFSKIEARELKIIPLEYRIADLINDSIQMNLMRIENKPIELELDIDENIPSVLVGDELRIKQVLNNLLSNAFKYTNEGIVTLTVAVKTALDNKTLLEINVRDTGEGMTEKQLQILFTKYNRLGNESNRAIEGTGLGLAITQNLIMLMDGEIKVESKPGEGSVFSIKLPQVVSGSEVIGKETVENLRKFRQNIMRRKKSNQLVRYSMPYGSVLIVDDIKMNIYVATELMKLYKLQIDTAISGPEAIEKIKAGKVYDIVFMDYMMPVMNGMEATKSLRALGYKNPIVALTANVTSEHTNLYIENGFDSFIAKPIDIYQLDKILNELIRDKQPQDVIEAAQEEKITQDENNVIIKIDGINTTEGVKTYGSKVFINTLQNYVSSNRALLDSLENLKDIDDYRISVHGIKGASYYIFANEIGDKAKALETAAENNDMKFIEKNNSYFIKDLKKLISDIGNLLREIDDPDSKPKKNKPDNQALSRLVEACNSFSINDVDEVMQEINKYCYESDNELVEFLCEKAQLMQYSDIVERLSK
ncbi:MAG: response regulator [Defluviitaleaceae bacterium]|nr:response regulator [Defluviitaleaceae bacterium]